MDMKKAMCGEPFAKRVEAFWTWFVRNEKKLSGMVRPKSREEADEFMAFVHEGTSLLSDNVNFNIGGDCEFSFSVEGWPDLFFLYPYVISRMPESLRGKWKFYPFNQGTDKPFGFRMYDADVDTERIMVAAAYDEGRNRFCLRYFEDSLNGLPREESDGAMWVILEHTLGEGISFKYVSEIEPAADVEDGMIALPELRAHMKERVEAAAQQFFENPKELYTSYHLTPQDSDVLRYDVIVGSTCLDAVVADYYNDSPEIAKHLESFGARAVFLVYANGECAGNDALNFRYDLEDRLNSEIFERAAIGQVLGGASGTENSYIDLLVYDLPAFVRAVRPLLEKYPERSFYLSDFRQNAELIQLSGKGECEA